MFALRRARPVRVGGQKQWIGGGLLGRDRADVEIDDLGRTVEHDSQVTRKRTMKREKPHE
ncbi:hypothetical protein L1D19_24920 [Vibrio natriegens]|uniref:hypothetical protein n=1 Tax=Vibrio natriegens TaxID=691 RepID=UPI001EFCC489|nr:hypothetical protein [Vibrio natriegens]MCG9703299.1 hypothetical protein [Vibrio natriegens]